ncbi:MAG: N-acetylmuramoyl-L-alanine amidase [Candidatus Tectomicrobia bacterium]|uniref:N-acetylmuramoyl-L-alanine amidase n=1 Tax=Tectimicrobiota bacterium TaxID=2528274 RepID=A0A932ZU18_UNCTE|nr:N-acetylmuramoyl-L-alanine amidase [Candidatus Tectomicrobia bacterium]
MAGAGRPAARGWWRGCLLLGAILGAVSPAAAARTGGPGVVAVRAFVTEGYARLTVLLDRETFNFHLGRLTDPPRLYLDIPAGRLGLQAPLPPDAARARLVRRVRFGHPDPKTLRMVVDLGEGEIRERVFSLPDPHRIIVELRGGAVPPPGPIPPAAVLPFPERPLPASPRARAVPPPRPGPKKRQEMSVAERFRAGQGRVMLDPGHGGKDAGAVGLHGLVEKDFVLDLARRAAGVLKRTLPGNEVLLTRTGDGYLPLGKRTAMANARDVDVFISIHANSSPLRGTHGIETYLLSEASSSRALEIAAKENDVTVAEMTDLQKILYDLMQRSKVNESRDLAEEVHRSLLAQLGRRYRGVNDLGVKRGPFYVLLGAQMPSILIEAGFITNPVDAKRSLQAAFRQALAEGIAEGVARFVGGPSRTARSGPAGWKRPSSPAAR